MKKDSGIMQIYNGKRGNYQDIPMSRECSSLLDNVINTDNKLKKALSKEPELLKLYSFEFFCNDIIITVIFSGYAG